jgi:hypothetical protein
MKYLIITYYQKPTGQYDEAVAVSQRLRDRDITTASVILDFSTRSVLKCSMNGVVVPKDFQRIRDFYHQYYDKHIDELEKNNEKQNNTD